jgi:dolichol-phosphate mannosyltransferase
MNQESARQKITAVIACYRDALAVPFMYQRLTAVFAKIGVDYEIIFVNDGSPDNADEVLAELAARDRNVVVVRHSRNFGSQNAFTSGMRISTGDAVVLLDGDLQDPPELIESFYQRWREGFDVVYGIRVKRVATRFLQIAYKVFYRIFRATSYVPMPLDAGDFSLLDRRVVNALNQLRENNRFLRGLRAWVGFKQTGVPYVRPERMFGVTTNSVLGNLGWARKALFSFSYAPIDVMTGLAIAIVILSVFLAALQIVIRFVKPEMVPTGFTTLIVLILFMGGIQLLCFSVIGGYLMHIYDEVKRRPPYIVDYILNDPSDSARSQQKKVSDS